MGGETIENLRYLVRRSEHSYNAILGPSLLARYGNSGWEKLETQPFTQVWLEKLDSFNNGFHQFGQTIKSIPNKDVIYEIESKDSAEYLFKELHWTENIGLSRFVTRRGKTYNLVNYEIK